MITRRSAIAQRRSALLLEIADERDRTAALIAELRTQVAIAALGLLAGRLLQRSRWLRLFAAGGAVLTAALPLFARWLPPRRAS